MAEREPPRGALTVGEIWQDLADGLFSFERGLPYTFATLWWKPATQARRYLATRDPALIRPLRYLLVAVAVYSALTWALLSQFADFAELGATGQQVAQTELVLRHAAWLVLLILPLIALLMRVLAWRSPLRFIDALVLLAYAQAQVLLGQALLVVPVAVFGSNLLAQIVGTLISLYMVFAIATFIPTRRWWAWIAAVLTVVLGTLANAVIVQLFFRAHAALTG